MTLALALSSLFAASDNGNSQRPTATDSPIDAAAAAAERALVEQVRVGDEDAFRILMEQHFPHAVRFAMGLLHDRAAAEDVAQEVFARVWTTRDTWKPTVSVRAYVLGAIRHRAFNVTKHASVVARHATSAIDLDERRVEATADQDLDRAVELAALQKAVAELPERRRVAVMLRYDHGLSHAEVGAALGVSAKAAKELIARTLEALYLKLRTLR